MKKISDFLHNFYGEIPQHYQLNYIILIYIEDIYDINIIRKNVYFCKTNNINYVVKRNKSEYIISELLKTYDIVIMIQNDYIPNYIDILLFIISNINYSRVMVLKQMLFMTIFVSNKYFTKDNILYLKDDTLNPMEIKRDTCYIKNIKHNKFILRLDEKYECNQHKLILSDDRTCFTIENRDDNFIISYNGEYLHSHHIKFCETEFEATTTDIFDNSSKWTIHNMKIINNHLRSNISVNQDTFNITSKYEDVNEWLFIRDSYCDVFLSHYDKKS